MGKPAYERLLEGLAPCVDDVPSFQASLAEVAAFGNVWYVDSVNGSDTANDGTSLDRAFATIATAVAAAAAYDTIFIRGSFSEAVTIALAGLRIIGIGTTPKVAQWTAAADEDCVTVTAQHVEQRNIYFRPPAYGSDRTTTAIKLSGAHYLRVKGCRFQGKTGSQAAIYAMSNCSSRTRRSTCPPISWRS